MGFCLIPKDIKFFELFNDQVAVIKESSMMLLELGKNPVDAETKARAIKKNENKCDDIMHGMVEKLNLTFITPIDREDIYTIASKLDDIMDLIDTIAIAISLYNIKELRPEAIILLENIVNICDAIKDMVNGMADFKKVGPIKIAAREVDKLENFADGIYFTAVARLFKEEANPIEVIKWEKMFSRLEDTTNKCKEVANIINTVIIKHS